MSTSFSTLISALAKEIGIPEAASSVDGIFRLEVEGTPLSVINCGESVLLYTSLGALSADPGRAEAARVLMLSANVLFRGTGGAALGVAPEDGAITLCWQRPLQGFSEGEFITAVELFLTTADEWVKRLEEASPPAAEPSLAAAPPADGSWTSV